MPQIRPPVVVCLVALAISLLAACGDDGGGGGDANEILDAAFQNASEVTSGVVTIDLNSTTETEGGSNLEVKATGPFQEQDKGVPGFDLDVDLNARTGEGEGSDISASGGLISSGDSAFLEYQDTAYELPDGVIEAPQALLSGFSSLLTLQVSGGEGDECTQALLDAGLDTSSFVDDLSAEGTEDVEGVETDHLTGQLDLGQVGENIATLLQTPACEETFGDSPRPTEEQIDAVKDQVAESAQFINDASLDFYVGVDDKLLRGFDADFSFEQDGEASDLDLQVRVGSVNEPQTISAPANTKPLADLLGQFGIDDQALGQLGQALGGGAGATGSGALPQAGGDPAGPSNDASAEYLECIRIAKGDAALQECAPLLE